MLRLVMGMTVGIACVTLTGCAQDGADDQSVLREQLFAVDYELVDAVDDVDALVADDDIVSAEALPGVDEIEYEIVSVEGDDVVTRIVDGRTRRVIDRAILRRCARRFWSRSLR